MTQYQTKPCKRCEGTGRLAHYGHVINGVCFKCKGAGFLYVTKKAPYATVMTREKVGDSGYSGWSIIATFWANPESTPETIAAKYVAAGHDPALIAVNITIQERKQPVKESKK